MTDQELIQKALEARERSYSPYSGFSVGAALLTRSGKVYQGANIENASFPVGCCAERTALNTAIYEGEKDFEAIAIVGGRHGNRKLKICAPCGICRQALSEFCSAESFRVLLAKSPEDYQVYTLGQLLPLGFQKEDME